MDLAQLLEENRQLRVDLDAARATNYAFREEKIRKAARLPLRLTVAEFAAIVRQCPETIRRKIRCRRIEACGQPYLIPRREVEKFGVSLADAADTFNSDAA